MSNVIAVHFTSVGISLTNLFTYTSSGIPNAVIPTISVQGTNMLPVRFGQAFDSSGNPIGNLRYLNNGYPTPNPNINSPYVNDPVFYNAAPTDGQLAVYDFYGLNLNDPTRGPYFSSQNVVPSSIDPTKLIVRKDNLGNLIYDGPLSDEFGNLAVGVQVNHALVVRQPVLPLALDEFNRPIKDPTLDV